MVIIFILLYFTFHSAIEASMVMLSVPFALVGAWGTHEGRMRDAWGTHGGRMGDAWGWLWGAYRLASNTH